MEEGVMAFHWGRRSQLLPGFWFQPTDQEIIVYYLKKKIAGTAASITSIIADVDIYKFDPWELPGKAIFSGDEKWFFFSPRDRKYPNGGRPNRKAGSGYWKATGTDRPILGGGGAQCLGVKKALVFYQGRSPKGTKTGWVMHEYRLLETDHIILRRKDSMRLDDWVLCRVRKKVSFLGSSDLHHQPIITSHNIDYDQAEETIIAPPPVHSSSSREDWNDDGHLMTQYLIGGGVHSNTTMMLVLEEESIKRKLSFQAIDDELYLLQPSSKRANNNNVTSPPEQPGIGKGEHSTQRVTTVLSFIAARKYLNIGFILYSRSFNIKVE